MAFWLGCCLLGNTLHACGPFFPNWMLVNPDRSVLVAPLASSGYDLKWVKPETSSYRAMPATNHPLQTLEAELADLRSALTRAQVPATEQDNIIERHRSERRRISVFVNPVDDAADQPRRAWRDPVFVLRPNPTNNNRISGSPPRITPGLPGEFADYFRGSIAWHLGNIPAARATWLDLLRRPPAERHFKSTWAAYMLGKSWEREDPDEAISHFQEVRELARQGFADSLGLVVASLGWEARLHWREQRYAEAIDLYLEQAAAGDPSAWLSLDYVASSALREGRAALRSLARHPRARRVITAYVVEGGYREPAIDVDGAVKEGAIRVLEKVSAKVPIVPAPKPSWHRWRVPVRLWLEAVEAADVRDMDSAERLALAAYQAGEMQMAQRWIERAATTPVTQWLQAKLLFRDGKLPEAAVLLAGLSRLFPVDSFAPGPSPAGGLVDNLFVEGGYEEYRGFTPAPQQIRAELGVLRLTRRQFVEALDLLFRAGFWADSAYVAEQVLTVDELKTYVDRHWVPEAGSDLALLGEKLRYLLGRRLARLERWSEARPYYPRNWLPKFDEMVEELTAGRDPRLPKEERGRALFRAACLMRGQGLELVGTEVGPDWHLHRGDFEEGPDWEQRIRDSYDGHLRASEEELNRASFHRPNPDLRWHYRWRAAHLAREAAALLPDNSDETARVLCIGGTWLKYIDPYEADILYKALVHRCRKTVLGAEADRLRWFPRIDKDGNLLPRANPVESEADGDESAAPIEDDAEGGGS